MDRRMLRDVLRVAFLFLVVLNLFLSDIQKPGEDIRMQHAIVFSLVLIWNEIRHV